MAYVFDGALSDAVLEAILEHGLDGLPELIGPWSTRRRTWNSNRTWAWRRSNGVTVTYWDQPKPPGQPGGRKPMAPSSPSSMSPPVCNSSGRLPVDNE